MYTPPPQEKTEGSQNHSTGSQDPFMEKGNGRGTCLSSTAWYMGLNLTKRSPEFGKMTMDLPN